MAVFRVEKNNNYTVMANHHLRNNELSLKAKGLLSLMLSLPETWDYTMAGLAAICKDGITCIRTTVEELEQVGYLTRTRIRNEKGQLTDTEYVIREFPITGKPTSEKPMLENPILDNPTLEKPISENLTQLNTNISSKEELSTDLLNTQSINLRDEEPKQPEASINERQNEIDSIDRYNAYSKIIKENIDYEILLNPNYRINKEDLDGIIDLMTETVCSTKQAIRIGGEEKPQVLVKSQLLKLDMSHIEYVLECLNKNVTKIYNIKNYLLTALFNAPTTISHYYGAEVRHDMYGTD